jgi:hypothetical protein
MKIDYNKKNFTEEEKKILLKESEILKSEYPDKIPILVQISSNVIEIEKNKFLVSGDINVDYFFETLKKKITGLNPSDSLVISVTKLTDENGKKKLTQVNKQSKLLKHFYEEHSDPETNMLIFTIHRQTTYKFIKGMAGFLYKSVF